MREIQLIVINENVIKINLASIVPAGTRLFLIASTRCFQSLSTENLERFERAIETNDFTPQNLVEIIESTFAAGERESINVVTNDECVEVVCEELRQFLGHELMSIERAKKFSDKLQMKRALANNTRVSCPKHIHFDPKEYLASAGSYVDGLVDTLSLPMVAKPIDGTSSTGVEILNSRDSIHEWCERNIGQENFEIDEFVDGILYSCDSIVIDGEIVFTQMGEGTFPCLDYAFGRNIGIRLLPNDSISYRRISEFNKDVLTALNAPDGAVHMEVFERPSGELVFLEIAARPAGGDFLWMYETALGVNIEAIHFAIRMKLPVVRPVNSAGMHAAFCLFPRRLGKVIEMSPSDFEALFESHWYIEPGEHLDATTSLASKRAGLFRFKHCDPDVIKRDFQKMKSFVPYLVAEQ